MASPVSTCRRRVFAGHLAASFKEILMKSMARALLFGGFILATQAAMAGTSGFPGATDDAGVTLPPRVTYADEHRNDRLANVDSTFPASAPDGVFLPTSMTYASEHAANSVAIAGSAFPDAVDDAGVRLIARSTYADTHLGAYRPEQDSGSAD
jgi:hypothetical protein